MCFPAEHEALVIKLYRYAAVARSIPSASQALAPGAVLQGLLYEGICCAVYICCSFIQRQDWRILQECPAVANSVICQLGGENVAEHMSKMGHRAHQRQHRQYRTYL